MIEKNERTPIPINRKAKNRMETDEDNVLMLSPDISVKTKVHHEELK